jgi:hypothetical protein
MKAVKNRHPICVVPLRTLRSDINPLGKRDKSELALKPEFSVLSALASLAKSALGGTRQAPKSS